LNSLSLAPYGEVNKHPELRYEVHQVLKLVFTITPSPSTISILFKES
jgi:hypothetical protein